MKDRDDKLRREIWKKLARQQNVFLATVDGNQPRLRPVTLIWFQNRFFFATGAKNAKVKQIMQNPKTELCLMFGKSESRGTIRAECIAKIIKEKNIKADVYNNTPLLGEFWKSPEDPNYTLIELQPVCFEYYRPGSIQAIKVEL